MRSLYISIIAVAIIATSSPAVADVRSECTESIPQPGTTCAYLRNKQPHLFATRGPDEGGALKHWPQPGTTEAFIAYKMPWLRKSEAGVSTGPVGYYPTPGTPEAFRCYKLGDCRRP
jgi:hypothetical protein